MPYSHPTTYCALVAGICASAWYILQHRHERRNPKPDPPLPEAHNRADRVALFLLRVTQGVNRFTDRFQAISLFILCVLAILIFLLLLVLLALQDLGFGYFGF
jgi:hypothetical protein